MADTLGSLAADLARAAATIGPVAREVVDKNARGVQQQWRDTWPWSGSRHLRKIAASITFDRDGNESMRGADIGPIKGGQGSLGHIIEFGSINSNAHPGGGPAAMKQAPIFAAEMAIAAHALLGLGTTMATSNPSRYNAPIGPRR